MRLLLADDDETMRLLLREWLSALGYQVTAVGDGRAAWAEFVRAPVPLLVVDGEMPGVDGLELCRRIRADGGEAGRSVFIIFLTARGTTDGLARVLDAGADDFLSKPVTEDLLRARLAVARRRIEQDAARQRAEAALARAQWLAGIGETTLALQHEINTPLAALLGTAMLLEQGMHATDAERDGHLRVIVEQAKRIAAVVKRLSALRDPRSVEYAGGAKMIDLSGGKKAE